MSETQRGGLFSSLFQTPIMQGRLAYDANDELFPVSGGVSCSFMPFFPARLRECGIGYDGSQGECCPDIEEQSPSGCSEV
jgi:hypothetical protein